MIKSNEIENIEINKNRLEAIIYSIPDGAILLDSYLKIVCINKQAIQILDLKDNIIQKGDIRDYLPKILLEELFPVILEIINQSISASQKIELKSVLPNKKIQFFLTPIIDITSTAHNFSGLILILKEIDSISIPKRFISNISHELKTPLCNVQSFLETLLEFYNDLSDNQKIEFLSTANTETQRLSRFVDNILKLSKLESNYKYHSQVIQMKSLTEEIFKVYQLTAKEKKISLFLETDETSPLVIANYDLLFQVMSNLVDNSIKFNHHYGKIIIRIFQHKPNNMTQFFYRRRKHKIFRIEISDNGIGIDSKRKQYIFERIHKLENIFHSLDGIGFGLSIAKTILKKFSSNLYFRTEVNVGTTFWFDLEQVEI